MRPFDPNIYDDEEQYHAARWIETYLLAIQTEDEHPDETCPLCLADTLSADCRWYTPQHEGEPLMHYGPDTRLCPIDADLMQARANRRQFVRKHTLPAGGQGS
jgi:hypothetical protein